MATHAMDAAALYQANRRVYIIDDLLGAILLIAAGALAVLLDLTRRQICAVYQLAFALCATCTFFIVGGLIDHHLSNEQLNLALYGTHLVGPLTTSYIYIPSVASLGISLAFLFTLSTCNCDCCCLVGSAAAAHQRCFASRIRANGSLYAACFAWLFVAIGTRLNVRLRESAINPVGGTVHWMMLRSPFFLAMAHLGSLLLVGLKIFLQHADRSPQTTCDRQRLSDGSMTANNLNMAVATTSTNSMVDELMRPPPVKSFPLAPRRSNDAKQAVSRSPQATTTVSSSKATSDLKGASPSRGSSKSTRRYSDNNSSISEPQNDGDVSSLISSDSDSDDSVLRPNFRANGTASAASGGSAGRTLPPRHGAAAGRRRPSGGASSVTSGYSSSPPASPTHSTTSTGSSTAFSSTSRPRASGGATTTRPTSFSSSSSSSAITRGRPRILSNASSSSTAFLSDHDDHLLSSLEAYGSSLSGNEAPSYLSDQRPNDRGIRRRAVPAGAATAAAPTAARRPFAPSLRNGGPVPTRAFASHAPAYDEVVAVRPATSTGSSMHEWIECLDETTGSGYYYNTHTGESRWKEQ